MPLSIAALVVRTAPKPLRQGQGLTRTRGASPPCHGPLGGKPSSALRPPTAQDRAALPRFHPRPKAVLLLAAAVVGLKSAFHGSRPSTTRLVPDASLLEWFVGPLLGTHYALELVNLAEDRGGGQGPASTSRRQSSSSSGQVCGYRSSSQTSSSTSSRTIRIWRSSLETSPRLKRPLGDPAISRSSPVSRSKIFRVSS